MVANAIRRVLVPVLATFVLANLAAAAAQASFDHPGMGFRIDVPAGWAVEEESTTDDTMLFLVSPGNDGGLIVAAGPLEGDERAAYTSGGINALVEPAFAIVNEVPGARRSEVFAATVGGREAAGFTYQADALAGRFVFLVANERIYVLGSLAEPAGAASIEAALQDVIGSFALTTSSARDDTTTANDAFVGTFAGDGLSITIERTHDGSYVGTLSHGDATYPLTAAAGPTGLTGRFTSGADTFAFELTTAGDTLVFATGGTHYTLDR